MAPALELPQIGQEMLACAVMGGVLGMIRAVFPKKGRAAFLPDVLYVGAMLFCLQSYTAAYSAGGVLRWYMVGSAVASAAAVGGLLGLPVRFLRVYRKKSFKKIQKELAK